MQEPNLKKTLAEARRAAAKDQLDKAIGGYRDVLQQTPDDVRLLMELAELLAAKGNRHEAVDTLLTAAEILSGRGQLKAAVGLYRRVLQLNALLVTAYVRLFEIFKALGMGKEARLFMYGAISIFQKAGFPEDLRNMLERIIEIDAEDEQIRLALAETNLKLKRTDVAILHFEASLPLLRKKGLDDLFIRAAEHIIYYRPDNIGLCRELASLYLGRLEGAKAEKLLLFCHQQDPRDIETLDLLVKLFIDGGNEKKAVSLLLQKAAILEEGGKRDEALEVCELVLRLDHRNADARQFINNAKKLRPRPSLIPRRLDSTSLVPMPSAIVEPNAPSFLEISLVTKMPQAPAGSPVQEVQEIRSPIAILDIAVGETGVAAQPKRSPTAKVPTTVQVQTRVSRPPVAKAPAAVQLPKRESRPPAAKVAAAVQVPKRESRPPAAKAEPPKKDLKPAAAREQAMSYVPPLASDSDLDWDKAVDILRTHVGDDAETHYDLGLAYMELEQWGEAISEFELAARNPAKKAICGYLRGQCHDRMNDILQAIACYKDGLTATEIDDDKEKSLWYELGAAYLKMEETRSALEWFEKINARDPGYRHAGQKVEEIRKWIAKVEDKRKRSTLILPALSMAGLPPPMKTLSAGADARPP
jgi:tetratricopeptide (TPR) repeat protein